MVKLNAESFQSQTRCAELRRIKSCEAPHIKRYLIYCEKKHVRNYLEDLLEILRENFWMVKFRLKKC
ncbi:hypothetical protein ES703_24865 [subsurface metagenome]